MVHFGLYLLLPTSGRAIRLPESQLGDGLLGGIVLAQYELATVWCACPSLHVSTAWFLFRVLLRYRPGARWPCLVWFVGLFLSIGAIKIHYLFDGLAGWALAEIVCRVVLLPLGRARAFRWVGSSRALRFASYGALIGALPGGLVLVASGSGFDGPPCSWVSGG